MTADHLAGHRGLTFDGTRYVEVGARPRRDGWSRIAVEWALLPSSDSTPSEVVIAGHGIVGRDETGRPVVVNPVVDLSSHGRPALIGRDVDGGLSSLVHAPPSACIALPDGVDLPLASLAWPIACALDRDDGSSLELGGYGPVDACRHLVARVDRPDLPVSVAGAAGLSGLLAQAFGARLVSGGAAPAVAAPDGWPGSVADAEDALRRAIAFVADHPADVRPLVTRAIRLDDLSGTKVGEWREEVCVVVRP